MKTEEAKLLKEIVEQLKDIKYDLRKIKIETLKQEDESDGE